MPIFVPLLPMRQEVVIVVKIILKLLSTGTAAIMVCREFRRVEVQVVLRDLDLAGRVAVRRESRCGEDVVYDAARCVFGCVGGGSD
jgi:hypothetical protein